MAKVNVKATWTGSYPCLCSGNWELVVDNVDVSNLIPKELRYSPMDTYGEYAMLYFEENWEEVWEYYEDGKGKEDWIEANKYWLDTINTDKDVQSAIFEAIQDEDWRHGSCGGCI